MRLLERMPLEVRHKLLGEVVSLLLCSNVHRAYQIADIGAVFFPPIQCNQFRLYHQNKRLVGLVTWAYLTPEVQEKYLSGTYNLHPEDWSAGDNLWIIDWISPFGHTKQIARDLRKNVFTTTQALKAIRIKPNGRNRGLKNVIVR